jgi:hypothetical protein
MTASFVSMAFAPMFWRIPTATHATTGRSTLMEISWRKGEKANNETMRMMMIFGQCPMLARKRRRSLPVSQSCGT